MTNIPNLGIGIGLRVEHYEQIFKQQPDIGFFEIISENFMVEGGAPLYNLQKILEKYPIVQHGVSLSIASAEQLDFNYLKKLKKLISVTKAPWISDHLCWTRAHTHHYHNLLPLPFTTEYANFIAEKARIVQDYLETPFALENLSSLVSFKESTMTEWEFYSEVVNRGNIHMMLDVNNVYVASVNHDFDPMDYLKNLPYEKVLQVHLAGHSVQENGIILDTHDNFVCDEVWDLYSYVHKRTGGVSTLLEWDDNFISLEDTVREAKKALKFQEVSSNA
ncbi:MAG: DUF692 domain-containing protein [Lentisphaeraceae bacterium]|nr:DUF692 domain-containing protein [Lentisphaeraceae bacterium]